MEENQKKAQLLKEERSRRKQKVTYASKRLTSAVEAGNRCEDAARELENCMDDFQNVHMEYCCLLECSEGLDTFRVVNGEDLDDYYESVNRTYLEATRLHQKSKIDNQVSPLKLKLEHASLRLINMCNKLEELFKDSSTNAQLIHSYSEELQPLLDMILDLMSQCDNLQTDSLEEKDYKKDALKLVCRVDDIMHQCKVIRNTAVPENETPQVVSVAKSRVLNDESLNSSVMSSDVFIKKIALPEFSGLRKDWPEFKTVWKELAEASIQSKSALAYQLKQSLKGTAKEKVQNIYVTRPDAYEMLWKRLSEYYDDMSASVQSVLDSLSKLKPVKEDDYKAMVLLVDSVESVYAQLEEIGHLDVLNMREIDKLCDLLPYSVRMLWHRTYHQLDIGSKLRPLTEFMKFLHIERASVARLTETHKRGATGHTGQSHVAAGKLSNYRRSQSNCVVHSEYNSKHKTADCRDFKRLSLDDKYKALRASRVCFQCFGYHRREHCTNNTICDHCKKSGHNSLLCRQINGATNIAVSLSNIAINKESSVVSVTSSSNVSRNPNSLSLYAIMQATVVNSGKPATVFCDGGSNTTYITHAAADRIKARKLDKYTLEVTTMGNVSCQYETRLYEVSLRTCNGRIVPVLAFGMGQITGPVSKLNSSSLQALFPDYDVSLLQRKSVNVDILLGCDYFGLHPKHEIHSAGDHLSIMQGELGVCLQGYHPDLREQTKFCSNMVRTMHDFTIKTECNHAVNASHPLFTEPHNHNIVTCNSMFVKSDESRLVDFITGEELGTQVKPQCGGCRCGKCPVVGQTYSFREEQELSMIRNGLRYDDLNSCWVSSYPWIRDPASLPDNYKVALATLKSTEKTLSRDTDWAEKYCGQMQDMVARGVARKLCNEEIIAWDGPVYYISHLAVQNPKSTSTPVRIVFNSSQVCHGVSLNSVLAKGPDNYINNIVGLLLRWREESVAYIGDIKKMFNSVHLEPLEQHCHRFLWRELDQTREPETYVMTRVNMGDRPAPAISTEALYQTALLFNNDSPAAAKVICKSSYVDDILDSVRDLNTAVTLSREIEAMLGKGGFSIKCWQFSGELHARLSGSQRDSPSTVTLLKGSGGYTRVLGVMWDPHKDLLLFEATLNFSRKRKGVRVGPKLLASQIPDAIPDVLTRRIVLEQTMSMFDPLGLLCPFTLTAKVLLRETWTQKLSWDDALSPDLKGKWISFFKSMFQVEDLHYPRMLKPVNAVGAPWLIILSDGSDLAYGAVAYIRWQLDDGSVWCKLIMAKCRIAPINKLSTPQMELNGAVMSKRLRQVIESEMRFSFDKVLHVVDSETVLCMINKVSTRFKVYEGVRLGEIQAASRGDMSSWAWISGDLNTADWLTRGRTPCELGHNSEWWNGPRFLHESLDSWGLKFGLTQQNMLPGEKKLASTAVVNVQPNERVPLVDYSRFSNIKTVLWVIARLLSIAKVKSFVGGHCSAITPALLRQAEDLVVGDAQQSMQSEFKKRNSKGAVGGKYAALQPVKGDNGLWLIGKRLVNFNPMTPDSAPQRLLAYDHPATFLFMHEAHCSGHRGRDGTLAKFREKYWTPHGVKLSWKVKNSCQLCKLRDHKLMKQEMGLMPLDRLVPAPAFSKVMIDFFGPYLIRGEVQKRTSGKAYGVIFTDLIMRAAHVEPVFGYDTSSFIMALVRFASLRGWPTVIYSDPGSQFVSADAVLKQVWAKTDRSAITRKSSQNGLQWVFGSADSPWQQGAVETLVKAAKKAINYAINKQRLSPCEFLTLCAEVTNLLNERPIGTMPSVDSDINILTPNSLLLGRAIAKNPGGWQAHDTSLSSRFKYVQQITDLFWSKWAELCAPGLTIQRKWHTSCRNLQCGDVVIIADQNSLRGDYKLGLVKQVFPGSDGKVRKVSLTYKRYKVGEKLCEYSGASDITVTRSVQKLALLIPVEDQ